MTEDTEEAWSRIADFQHVFLATMEGSQPRVRPVTLINFDGRFWIMTDTWSEKVKQIHKNPNVEFSFTFADGDEDCCMRVTGLAKTVEDKQLKTKLAKHCDFFSKHWKTADDPNYTLLEVCPAEIVIVRPHETTRMKV
jgi:general stress protein 26